jgi:hypothetical protein
VGNDKPVAHATWLQITAIELRNFRHSDESQNPYFSINDGFLLPQE